MRRIDITGLDKGLLYSSSSKGNLPKWRIENKWYKTDGFGYESLCEVLISRLAKGDDVFKVVNYDPIKITIDGMTYNGCESPDFLKPHERLITLEKMHRAYKGRGIGDALSRIHSLEDSIRYCVDFAVSVTGLDLFGKYFAAILQNDALFLNEDRHYSNIAVIYNEDTDTYRLCPVFDNGLSLCSALDTYPMGEDVYILIERVEAKPFDRDFVSQVEAADKLYSCDMNYSFSKKDIEDVLSELTEYYDKKITDRVRTILFEQMRKWHYLLK